MAGAKTQSQGLGRSVGSATLPETRNQKGPRTHKQVALHHPQVAEVCWAPNLKPGKTENPTIPGQCVNKSLPQSQSLPGPGQLITQMELRQRSGN